MFGPIELAQNDFLIVLDFTLLILFARYVWYRVFVDGIYEGFGAWEVFSRPATKIGWALMLTYASRWLDRLSFFFWDHHNFALSRGLAIASLPLAVWSAACVVRIFLGTAWGPRAWIWAIGAAVVFALILVVGPYFTASHQLWLSHAKAM